MQVVKLEFHANVSQQKRSVLCFSLFFGWLLSFPFEGPVFYALAADRGLDAIGLNLASVFSHFVGLMTAWLFVNSLRRAKQVQILACGMCFVGSSLFLIVPDRFWLPLLSVMSFIAGWIVAAWGYYAKYFFQGFDRVRMMADILIYSNLYLVAASVLTKTLSPIAGMTLLLIGLAVSAGFARRLADEAPDSSELIALPVGRIDWPFLLLCLFVFVITINSGIMYQVVYPAYPGYEGFSSFYQVIPYIVAIWLLRLYATKIGQFHILYIGLALLGLAYAFFILLDRSLSSYLIVDTLMLAACGVNDLFWWSILGAILNYDTNPARIMGVGLAMNVLGVWYGGVLGANMASTQKGNFLAAGIAFIIIFVSMFIIPVLNKKLLHLLREHVFLLRFAVLNEREQDTLFDRLQFAKHLTDREIEITQLLVKGYTYKAMAKQLFISENTLKTHVRNIYGKLAVNSRMELIRMLEDDLSPEVETKRTLL